MNESQVRWASGLSLLAGLYLVLSPLWISNSTNGNMWQIIIGAVIAAMAIGQMAMPRVTWMSWVNLLAGVYFIIAPLATTTSSAVRWSQIVLGVIVSVLSMWSLAASTDEVTEPRLAPRRTAEGFYERLDDDKTDRR